jgi:antitoxin component of RelBE/YafQ-DinJ toxin-antitoxin module
VKKNTERVCTDIGISMATAITVYLKKLARKRREVWSGNINPRKTR